jgi:hypothetical protein
VWLLPLLAADFTVVAAVPVEWRAELLLLLTARPSAATQQARKHLVMVLQAAVQVCVWERPTPVFTHTR